MIKINKHEFLSFILKFFNKYAEKKKFYNQDFLIELLLMSRTLHFYNFCYGLHIAKRLS